MGRIIAISPATEEIAPKRGDLYLHHTGHGILIVSDSRLNARLSHVQAIVLTNRRPKEVERLSKYCVIIAASETLNNHCEKIVGDDSYALVTQTRPVKKSQLGRKLGRVDGHALARINRALLFVSGLEKFLGPASALAPLRKAS